MTRIKLALIATLAATPAIADPAKIENATATASGNAWTVSVTLRHGDAGWVDYAYGLRVFTEDGTILGTRTLFHPHVNEQPFTRSQSGIEIPADMAQVFIEASTNTDGWAMERYTLILDR